MASIPKVLDYGARPSLRTGRVDIPGQGELAVADSIAVAADTFGRMMVQHKVKEDAFNYSMAKQEYLTADLAQREKLKDDRDYETYDDRYRTGLLEDRDRILSKWKLTPADLELFHADADLIRERGAASVQEFRRVIEIDHNLAELDGSLEMVREKIILAEPGSRNEILQTALDQINAAQKKLWLNEEQAKNMRQRFVQDVALASLEFMDPEPRKQAIEKSLKYRKGLLAPLTTEQIAAGEGTDSIADFLHADTAKAMLEATKKELEINTAQAEGFATNDEAWRVNPGLSEKAQRARVKAIKDAGLSSEARKAAEAANVRKTLMEANIRSEGYREADEQLKALIDDGAAWEETPGALRAALPPGMHKTRKDYAIAARRQEDFPSVTSSEAIEAYAALSLEEQIDWSPDNWMVRPPLLDPKRWGDHVTREQATAWTNAAGQYRRAVQAGRTPETGLTPTQQLEAVFTLVMKKPTAASIHEAHQKWNRMLLAYHNAAIKLGGEDTLSPEQRIKLAYEITQFEVYERIEMGFDVEGTNWATMSPEQIERGYLKLDQPVPPFGFTASTMELDHAANEAIGMPAFKGLAIDWLKEIGSSVNPIEEGLEPTEEVLTEAWFYLVTTGPEAALNRLRGLPGY